MMRSWARATSAPAAIFHSKRRAMYRLTSSRKTISATRAFREIVLPHVALTSCPLMSLTEIPARLARAAFSRSASNVGGTVGDGATVGEAEAEADAVAEGDADGEADPDADAEAEACADAEADGATEGDGAAAVTPRSVRLRLVLI